MEQTIRIIAAVVDTQQLVMYKPDGSTIIIQQGDHRIRKLVDYVFPTLEARIAQGLPPQCDIPEEMLYGNSSQAHYAETEKQLGGAVKFFRMLKTKAREIIEKFVDGDRAEPHAMVGQVPVPDDHPTIASAVAEVMDQAPAPVTGPAGGYADGDSYRQKAVDPEEAPLTKSSQAVAEIMAQAAPATSPEFVQMAKEQPEETTVVAVLEDGTVIDGIEQIDVQLKAVAAKLGSPVGMANFFKRVASVKRAHSVKDILTFMEKGELPIADDGTILVYKRLLRRGDHYVDCHSKNVKQRVGSHVFMDEKLVDANRRTECSNGLHVARRDYLRSFSGDVCVLAKLAPEDVIAVPHNDARKLRAKGYFIIAELSQEDHDNVTNNRALKDTKLLGNAAAGIHTPVIETVQITQGYGGGVIITPVGSGEAVPVELKEDLHAESIEHLNEQEDVVHEEVDAAAVALKKPAAAEPTAPIKKPVQVLIEAFTKAENDTDRLARARNLLQFKKNAKKAWDKLGVPQDIVDRVLKLTGTVEPAKPEKQAPAKKVKPVKQQQPKKKPAPKSKPVVKPKAAPLKALPKADTTEPKLKGQALVANQLWVKAIAGDKIAARDLLDFKKKAKKSWSVLGLDADAESKLKAIVG